MSKKSKKLNAKLMTRDKEILLFLWKWKMATTSLLAKRFFSNQVVGTAYNRLLALKLSGYLDVKNAEGREKPVWTLDRKGFDSIRWMLPSLQEEGYKSENIRHDLYVLALHLGDFLKGNPKNVELFSEQQLRRLDIEEFPSWVPTSRNHRPDGYTRIQSGEKEKIISIEVELSRKNSRDYEDVARFYRDYDEITRVLWMTPNLAMAKRIQDKLSSLTDHRDNRHNFIILKQFIKSGWNTLITKGPEQGKPVHHLFYGTSQEVPINTPSTSMGTSILDTNLIRVKSAS